MFCCGLGFSVSLLIFCCVCYGTFCYQVSEHFFLPLCLFCFDLKFLLLVKWKSTKGHGEGMEVPNLFAEERKIGKRDKKEKIQRNL